MATGHRVGWVFIASAVAGVLACGLLDREPMIGDEVTHYYVLVTQARQLPRPTVEAFIPMAGREPEHRFYPHVFLWHYLGGIVYKAFGGSFSSVQVYHTLFWLQLLIAALGLARLEFGEDRSAINLYLLVLASPPMLLLLAVGFYQDVPMMAQVVTAFYLLRRRRLGWSLLFMALAFSIKITALFFTPPYVLVTWIVFRPLDTRSSMAIRLSATVLALVLCCVPMAATLRCMGWEYYPQTVLRLQIQRHGLRVPAFLSPFREAPRSGDAPATRERIVRPPFDDNPAVPVIANNPGDARIPRNYLVFGGGVIWVLAAMTLYPMRRRTDDEATVGALERHWPSITGGCFAACVTIMLWSSSDLRFFAPALPFLLLPVARRASRFPWRSLWWPALILAATLQAGLVLWKIHDLRGVPRGVTDAIHYLEAHPPSPNRVFMYPEGNYRLFPCDHDWYLGYRLRDLWRGNNDQRLALLQSYNVGAIVIKRRLVRDVAPDSCDLGVYPSSFVRDIDRDPRFPKCFENRDVVIYAIPPRVRRHPPAN